MKKFRLLSLVTLGLLSLGACGDSDEPVNSSSQSSQTEQSSTELSVEESPLLKDNKNFKSLAINNGADEAEIVAQKDYQTTWSDSSWSGVNISIDEVSIIKLENYEDYSGNQYPGFIIAHYVIDNTERDVSIYPEQATINTNTGEQSEGNIDMKGFAGDIMTGSKINGYAAYPLNNLENVDDINQIRLKFNASYSTDDYDDENAYHEYDLTIDLA